MEVIILVASTRSLNRYRYNRRAARSDVSAGMASTGPGLDMRGKGVRQLISPCLYTHHLPR